MIAQNEFSDCQINHYSGKSLHNSQLLNIKESDILLPLFLQIIYDMSLWSKDNFAFVVGCVLC